MKYHVNPETGVVGQCRANKEKCPFGGASGNENHFPNKAAATTAAEALMEKKFPRRPLKAKKTPEKVVAEKVNRSDFEEMKKNILTGLMKANISTDGLPPVKNEKEIVEKWFNGNQEKFELIARISNPSSQLKDRVKDSVSTFVQKGNAVGFKRNPEDFAKVKKDFNDVSDIDLIDDFEGMEDLKSGNFDFFKGRKDS